MRSYRIFIGYPRLKWQHRHQIVTRLRRSSFQDITTIVRLNNVVAISTLQPVGPVAAGQGIVV